MTTCLSFAQPTLPDLDGSNEKGIILLTWVCQYDGVKSIAVLHSADSTFNYSTIGYVKRVLKGVQAFADGHPYPGKNYYKLSIVFNSGLTWTSNFHGVYIDSFEYKNRRINISNEALQKLIVNETAEKTAHPEKPKPIAKVAPADRDKYMEVLKKEPAVTETEVHPKFNLNKDTKADPNDYLSSLPEDTKKRMTITYADVPPTEIDPDLDTEPGDSKPAEPQKKKISITFDDKEDIHSFIETLPKQTNRNITLSYNADAGEVDPKAYLNDNGTRGTDKTKPGAEKPKAETEKPKKITMTFKNEEEVQAYMASLPKASNRKITLSYNIDSAEYSAHKLAETKKPTPIKPRRVEDPTEISPDLTSTKTSSPAKPVEEVKKVEEPPRPKISIKFSDDMNAIETNAVKSKYISMDNETGNVRINLPDDVATHNYSLKFFDKEKHAVIEVPKINAAKIILDKRNFQKKGQYKFTIRKDILELESGYITIY